MLIQYGDVNSGYVRLYEVKSG